MPPTPEVDEFIAATFRSVWTLELLLLLRYAPDRSHAPAEMVAALRASNLIVARGAAGLAAAGLIVVEGDGSARYQPATAELDAVAAATQDRYARSPNAVRRIIVGSASRDLAAFADAFRLRRD